MLDRVYAQKEAIASYGVDHELPHLTYPLMSNVIKVLKPFEEITRVFSSDKEIASSIIPTISTLKLYLGKKGNDFGVGTLKDSLLISINERFTSGSKGNICLESSFLQIATFLDPRYKDKFIKNKESLETVISEIINELISLEVVESDAGMYNFL